MKFFKENWVTMLTLLIALFGGVPGIISVLRTFKNRPILSYRFVNYVSGDLLEESSGKKRTFIFLSGTVSNAGLGSLTPAYFELKGSLDNETFNFRKKLIPETISFDTEEESILLDNPSEKDLQRFSESITTGMPVYGHLLFTTSDIGSEKLKASFDRLKLTLICVDVFGKEYDAPVKFGLDGQGKVAYPKHGIKIIPKQ